MSGTGRSGERPGPGLNRPQRHAGPMSNWERLSRNKEGFASSSAPPTPPPLDSHAPWANFPPDQLSTAGRVIFPPDPAGPVAGGVKTASPLPFPTSGGPDPDGLPGRGSDCGSVPVSGRNGAVEIDHDGRAVVHRRIARPEVPEGPEELIQKMEMVVVLMQKNIL
jgi:hypothetical protein